MLPETRGACSGLSGVLLAGLGVTLYVCGVCCACSSSGAATGTPDAGSATTGGDAVASGDAARGDDATLGGDGAASGMPDGSCSTDPLHTGLTAVQTGISVDAFDCQILEWTAKYGEPDPMVFKAIIYVESRFDDTAVACPNLPCGTPSGWTAAESGCYGLMQVVPACGGDPGDAGLLSTGHPNLTTSTSAPGWATSIFNPEVNIEIGISGVAGNRAQVEKQFSGCTTDQYTMMAVGNYNSYGSTKSCTVYNTSYDNAVIMAYQQYATAAGYTAHKY